MSTQFAKALSSKLMFWVVGAVVGSYFLFAIDTKQLTQGEGSFIQRLSRSIYMPRINLGIDLQGGTHLVVSVDIEKALENKLTAESRSLEKMIKREGGISSPLKKEVKDNALVYTFAEKAGAQKAYNLLKENSSLKFSIQEELVSARLSSAEETRIRSTAVDQAEHVLRTRLDSFDVRGLLVNKHGERKIVVQLPGKGDAEDVKSQIMKAARLEFKIIEKVAHSKDALLEDYDGHLSSDKMIIPGKRSGKGEDGAWYLVSAFPDLTGEHIVNADAGQDQMGRPAVDFELSTEGGNEFRELTANNSGRQLGIVMDDVVISAPSIKDPIGKRGQITGTFSVEEVRDLSSLLRSGALLAPLKFEQENRIGSSLGQDSINKGLTACLVALALLFIFSLLYYKISGFFAILALLYNLLITLVILAMLNGTLTLPGIAGMVLTIGMAIDASILIYERMREELATGSSLRKAVKDGFDDAIVVILDSNITTFLTGLVLFYFGGPAIKGFAVTLMIGIVATLISGVLFLRSMFDFVCDHTSINKLSI